MADGDKSKKRKLVIKRKRETVRERADKSSKKNDKTLRTRKFATSAIKPVTKAGKLLRREYTPIKTGNSKIGKRLGKRGSLAPSYFVLSYRELGKVTWPNRKTAAKLTLAVALFSVFLAVMIMFLDLGFDRLFKDVILK